VRENLFPLSLITFAAKGVSGMSKMRTIMMYGANDYGVEMVEIPSPGQNIMYP
jgi:hypothetical protein